MRAELQPSDRNARDHVAAHCGVLVRVLHAMSSPALDPRFVACNMPAAALICQPMHIARNDCTQ